MNLTNEERRWAQNVSEKLNTKYAQVRERSAEKIPYIARDGVHDNKLLDDPNWWTNGFWAGLMWQQYKATGEERYMDAALRLLHSLDERHIDWDPARDGLLTHCSAAYHNDSDRHVNMVYGDYFFVEAVRKLCGDGVWLW